MTSDERVYIRYRIARAGETMEEARIFLANGLLHGAVNRLYYACFYLVSALLLTEGLSPRKHSGVRSLFDQRWVKTARLPAEMSQFYREIMKHREQGDYGDLVSFRREEVGDWLLQAETFIRQIKTALEEQLGSQGPEEITQ